MIDRVLPNDFNMISCSKRKTLSLIYFTLLLSFLHYKHRKGLTFPPSYYSLPNSLSPTAQSFSLYSFATPLCLWLPHWTNIQLCLNLLSNRIKMIYFPLISTTIMNLLFYFTPQFRGVLLHDIDYQKEWEWEVHGGC